MPALLPEYAGLSDPVADLRAACLAAAGWLAEAGGPVEVVAASALGRRVAEELLTAGGSLGLEARRWRSSHLDHREAGAAWFVVGNGSARRTEKAPGHLHPGAHDFDATLEKALRAPDPSALAGLDEALAAELWADVAALRRLGELLDGAGAPEVDYADDPFGVQYWVMRWTCAS